jgi:hypothetical protein
MAAYALALFVTVTLLNAYPDAAWRVPLALIPMVPLIFALIAFMRFLSRMDELQRRVQLEALAFAFGGTALLTFSYGFLQIVGFPQVNWFAVWPIMAVLWIVGLYLANRRYN